MGRYSGLIGLIAIVFSAYLFSTKRTAIQLRVIAWGVVLQFSFAFLVLKTPFQKYFQAFSAAVNAILNCSAEGARFVFGDNLGLSSGPFGVILAFQILPIVIFICSLFAILYYFGVMQVCVKAMAIVMQRFMGTSGAESTCVAASIVMGQTGSACDREAFFSPYDRVRTFYRDDQRHGARFRICDGRLRHDRACLYHPLAYRRHHDGASDHHAGKDVCS